MKYLVEGVFKMLSFDRGCLKRSIRASSVSTQHEIWYSHDHQYTETSVMKNMIITGFRVYSMKNFSVYSIKSHCDEHHYKELSSVPYYISLIIGKYYYNYTTKLRLRPWKYIYQVGGSGLQFHVISGRSTFCFSTVIIYGYSISLTMCSIAFYFL
jgi:hypothetical protein